MDQLWSWMDAVPAGQYIAVFVVVLIAVHLAGLRWDKRQSARRLRSR